MRKLIEAAKHINEDFKEGDRVEVTWKPDKRYGKKGTVINTYPNRVDIKFKDGKMLAYLNGEITKK